MYIKFRKEIEIPSGFYCNGCRNLENAEHPRSEKQACKEFNRFLLLASVDNSMRIVKCDECICAITKHLRGF